MTDKKIVATENAPAALGPYSQAVGYGGLVYCSGQIALDPKTGEIVSEDVAAQTEQVLTNLAAVLAEAGSSLNAVLKTTVFLTDLEDFGAMNDVYARFFGESLPARATVEVSRLPKNVCVEIDCIAIQDFS